MTSVWLCVPTKTVYTYVYIHDGMSSSIEGGGGVC
jgi:hypothetical protein